MPIAEADADQILQEAEATKQERINDANAQVAMFNAKFEEYEKNPEVTKKRMFYLPLFLTGIILHVPVVNRWS